MKWDFNTPVHENLTLKAKWKKKAEGTTSKEETTTAAKKPKKEKEKKPKKKTKTSGTIEKWQSAEPGKRREKDGEPQRKGLHRPERKARSCGSYAVC